MKINIKSYILGCISMLVLVGIIFGGVKLFDKFKHDKEIQKQKEEIKWQEEKENSKKETIDGITYTVEYEGDNQTICDAYKNLLHYNYRYIVTNDGDIYLLNDKKYSDTNQNCKLYDENIKIKTIVDGSFISNDNKVYVVDYDRNNVISFKESTEVNHFSIPDELFNDDIKYAFLYDSDTNYEQKTAYKEYIVLKTDGKLYKMYFKGNYNNYSWDWEYKLESNELYQEFDGEKIKRFELPTKYNNKQAKGYIITDKNIYLQTPINKECLEYADVECKYEYKVSKYLQKYIDSLVQLQFSMEAGTNNGIYQITTYDKRIDVSVKEN